VSLDKCIATENHFQESISYPLFMAKPC